MRAGSFFKALFQNSQDYFEVRLKMVGLKLDQDSKEDCGGKIIQEFPSLLFYPHTVIHTTPKNIRNAPSILSLISDSLNKSHPYTTLNRMLIRFTEIM